MRNRVVNQDLKRKFKCAYYTFVKDILKKVILKNVSFVNIMHTFASFPYLKSFRFNCTISACVKYAYTISIHVN